MGRQMRLSWCIITAVLVLVWVLLATPPVVGAVEQAHSTVAQSYSVEFHTAPLQKKLLDSLAPEQVYPMRHTNGSLYVCVVPRQEEVDRLAQEARVLSARYRDGMPVPVALAHNIHTNMASLGCMTTRSNGWWSYELCWGMHVRQFHGAAPLKPADETLRVSVQSPTGSRPGSDDFVLGNVTSLRRLKKVAPTPLVFGTDTEGRFIGTTYGNGTWCDVRDAPRRVHIRLFCNTASTSSGEVRALDVKEQDTCDYVLRLYTTYACVPELRTSRVHQTLPCYPVHAAE